MIKKTINSGYKIIKENVLKDIDFFGSFLCYILAILISSFIDAKLSLILLISFTIIMLIIFVVRLIYFKERPNKQAHSNLLEKIDASSFPSLHSARVFSLATIFSYYISFQLNLSIVFFSIALMTGFSRIYKGKHDGVDVFIGSLVGILISYLVYVLLW